MKRPIQPEKIVLIGPGEERQQRFSIQMSLRKYALRYSMYDFGTANVRALTNSACTAQERLTSSDLLWTTTPESPYDCVVTFDRRR